VQLAVVIAGQGGPHHGAYLRAEGGEIVGVGFVDGHASGQRAAQFHYNLGQFHAAHGGRRAFALQRRNL
jgi:hypothetical protein